MSGCTSSRPPACSTAPGTTGRSGCTAQRWPGFQLANQAPKTGQLLVVDDEKTYAVRVFYRRNVHSPMFFPGAGRLPGLCRPERQRAADRRREGIARAGPVAAAVGLLARARRPEVRLLESEAFGGTR